jgi:hypothetical protein
MQGDMQLIVAQLGNGLLGQGLIVEKRDLHFGGERRGQVLVHQMVFSGSE